MGWLYEFCQVSNTLLKTHQPVRLEMRINTQMYLKLDIVQKKIPKLDLGDLDKWVRIIHLPAHSTAGDNDVYYHVSLP